MVITNGDVFRTSDTALAAYLVSAGFTTPEIDFNGNKAYFIFSPKNNDLEKSISEFDTARAEGNIVLFFNAYQSLLRRIRERY